MKEDMEIASSVFTIYKDFASNVFNVYWEHRLGLTALIVIGLIFHVRHWKFSSDLKKVAPLRADERTIEECLAKWKRFRPDFMPVILEDLTMIRKEQEFVRIGHLSWLANKLMGLVPSHAKPPRFD